MRVLVLFIDMLRANRLATFNNNISKNTVLDECLINFGGTLYTNCFTQGPDTPRGVASVYTGKSPNENGCNGRLKWPREFLDKSLPSIFDLFDERGYKIDIFSDPRERAVGLFPKNISEMPIHNDIYDIENFLSKIALKKKHFIFLSLPQFHWTIDAYGASKNAEKLALDDVSMSFNNVFNLINKDDFDHIFIFSDHGFKFFHEMKLEKKYMLLNDDRTHTVMMHRKKFQKELIENKKLCSISDIFPSFQEILGLGADKISLFSEDEREYIVIEDHFDFLPSVNQNIDIWAVVNHDYFYIRTLEEAYLVDRRSDEVVKKVSTDYDTILRENTSFDRYKSEHDRIFVYSQNLQKEVGSDFKALYDRRREKRLNIISNFFKIRDLLLKLLMR